MNVTEQNRRADALEHDNVTRRQLCDMVAHREADMEDLMAELLQTQVELEQARRTLRKYRKAWKRLKGLG